MNNSAHGGAREGAGRPLSTYRGNQYTGATPIEKLWRWLAERYGEEAANEAHLYFNEAKRSYEKQKITERKERLNNWSKEKLAWANHRLDHVTDVMSERDMPISPKTLSEFFQQEEGLSLTEQEAENWLATQDWYVGNQQNL